MTRRGRPRQAARAFARTLARLAVPPLRVGALAALAWPQVAGAAGPKPATAASVATAAATPESPAPRTDVPTPTEEAPAHDTPAPTPPPSNPEPPPDEAPGIGPLGGQAVAYARAPHDAPYQQVSASLWFKARPRFTAATYANLVVTGDAMDASLAGGRVLRARVREGYVGLRDGGWDIRLGQQIIPWGSSDVINPTDVLTARDYTFFSADPEANRLGAISALVSYAIPATDLAVTLVATPVFPGSQIIVPASAIPPGVTIGDPSRPAPRPRRTELAAKVKYTGTGWDIAAIGFHGYNHTPEFELRSIEPTGEVVVGLTHHAQSIVGLDGSASFGRWVFRLEGAYVMTDNPRGDVLGIQPSYATGVLGVERSFFERLRVQAQLATRYYHPGSPTTATTDAEADASPQAQAAPAAQRAAIDRKIDDVNALLLNYQDRHRPMGTLRVAYQSENEKFSAEVFGMVNFIGYDYLIRPMLGYRFTDALNLQLGYERFGGDRSRPLGALGDYSGVFVQGTFTF